MTLFRLLLRSLRGASALSSVTYPRPIATATTTFTRLYISPLEREIRKRRRVGFRPEVPLDELELHRRLESIIRCGDLDLATSTLRDAVLSQKPPCRSICIQLMMAMNNVGHYKDVVALFTLFFDKWRMGEPEIGFYNILIEAHCSTGDVDKALDVYHHVLEETIHTDTYRTYRPLTKGLISANRLSDARDLLRRMHDRGLRADAFIYNNYISAYLDLNDAESANELLNVYEHSEPSNHFEDGVIYGTYMDYYFKHNLEKEAMESYQRFLDLGLSTSADAYNVLLETLLKHGKSAEAHTLFELQLNSHNRSCCPLSSQTFNIMANECFRSRNASEALSVFRRRGTHENVKPFVMDVVGYNNMIEKFCGIGMVAEADKLFEEMLDMSVAPNVITFEILFDAYFKEDRTDDVLKWFKHLLFKTDLKPSSAFVNSVFSRLVNKGRIEEAGEVLGKIPERDPEPFPTSSCELVLTELCKRGKLDCILDLLGLLGTHKICVTPKVQGIIQETFGKEERIGQIMRLLGEPNEGGLAQGSQCAPGFQHCLDG